MAIGMNKEMARKPSPDKKKNSKQEDTVDDIDDLSATEEGSSTPMKNLDKKTIGIIAVVIIIIIVGVMAFAGDNKQKNEDEALSTELVDENDYDINGVYDENGNTIDPNGINPGISSFDDSDNLQTDPVVYDANDMISDLNGLDVSAVYNVEHFDYVDDYITYETRRAIIDDGMELYWVEAEYNGLKYRIQVPFYYYRSLGKSGIHKARIEVLTLVGGGKIISYMQLVDDNDSAN